jgi:hypothetical protein
MSKKILFDPIPSGFALLNKSYNSLKAKGDDTLSQIKDYLEDDNIRVLFHVKDHGFGFIKIEVFDLTFIVRMEIELTPEYNSFKKGFYKTYLITEDKMQDVGISYMFDHEGKLYNFENKGFSPDYIGSLDFVLHFIGRLFRHITTNQYTTVPNSTFEE